uniref:Uncharacterized protein n=1 Tax=Anguilla anguilla TaxID=7936 RepID=A0A0E9SUU8_ANGAN
MLRKRSEIYLKSNNNNKQCL